MRPNNQRREEGKRTITKNNENKDLLTRALESDDLKSFKNLLDSSRYYNICDEKGYSLLQLSIISSRKNIFDYLLSQPHFPINHTSPCGLTALQVAVDKVHGEYYIIELIKRGVNFRSLSLPNYSTFLHYAIRKNFYKLFNILIEKGFDLNERNSEGLTPLELALTHERKDMILSLLTLSAEPSLRFVEISLDITDALDWEAQDILFLYIVDEYSELELRLDVLLILATERTDVFFKIMKQVVNIIPECELDVEDFVWYLCEIDINCLKILLESFSIHLKEAIVSYIDIIYHKCHTRPFHYSAYENFMLLFNSDLCDIFLTLLSNFEINHYKYLHRLEESQITELYCIYLSGGCTIYERDLSLVYEKHGNCELFQILLHMDFKLTVHKWFRQNIMAVMMYDVTMTLETFLETEEMFNGVEELFHYFADPKLKEEYGYVCEIKNLPEIPLLMELARNSFRQHFIKTFNITTSKQFLYFLSNLRIPKLHKEIITYQKMLY